MVGVPVTPGHLARSWESEPSLSPSSQAHILPPSDDAVCCQGRRGHGMTKAYGPAPRPICLQGDNSAAEPRVLTHPSCSATSVCNQHPLFSVSLSGLLPTFPSGRSEPPTEAQCCRSHCLPGHTWTSTSLSVLDAFARCLEILPSDSGLLHYLDSEVTKPFWTLLQLDPGEG